MGADGQPVRLPRQLGRVLRVQDLPGGLQGQERPAGRPALEEGLRGDLRATGGSRATRGRRRSPPTICRRPATTASTPVCIPCCPTEAVSKTEAGIVLIDESRCRNCHACELACPYGAIRFNPARNTTTKCDFCADLLDIGKPPACVAGCPNRALDFGDLADLRRAAPDRRGPGVSPAPGRGHASGGRHPPASECRAPCRPASPRSPTGKSSSRLSRRPRSGSCHLLPLSCLPTSCCPSSPAPSRPSPC